MSLDQTISPPKTNDVPSARNMAQSVEIDSGHPSLETTPSDSPKTQTPIPSAPDAFDEGPAEQSPEPVGQYFNGSSKPNPFIVNNGVKRAPNKIILDPIEHPAAVKGLVGQVGSVPSHLFAAKNPNKNM